MSRMWAQGKSSSLRWQIGEHGRATKGGRSSHATHSKCVCAGVIRDFPCVREGVAGEVAAGKRAEGVGAPKTGVPPGGLPLMGVPSGGVPAGVQAEGVHEGRREYPPDQGGAIGLKILMLS